MTAQLGRLAYVAAAVVRRQLRDRLAGVFVVLLPLGLILLLGLAIGSGGRVKVGLAVPAGDGLAASLAAALPRGDALDVTRYPDPQALERAVRRGDVQAGVEVPAGYRPDALAGRPVRVRYLTARSATVPPAVRAAVDGVVDRQAVQVAAARSAAGPGASGAQLERAYAVAGAQLERAGSAALVRTAGAGSTLPLGLDYSAPAVLVMFMFLTALGSAQQLVAARGLGTVRRALTTPTRPWVLLAGEAAGRWLLAVLQAVVVVVGGLLFGVSWGPPVGVALVVAVFAAVAAAASLLLAGWARTPETAFAATPPLGIVLGMLGGCLWPLTIVGPVMTDVGHLAPQAWAVDAVLGLGSGHGLDAAYLHRVLVLAGFAAALALLAAMRFRRGFAAG